MKKKIVVKVSMDDQKSRSKALKISVCISGVESASLKGDQVEVIGEGIDAVELTRQLRKSMSHAELVSVGEVKKEENTAAAAKAVAPQPQPQVVWMTPYAPPPYGAYSQSSYPTETGPGCTIM